MSAMLNQIQELLSEHHAALSYGVRHGCRCLGCHAYIIAIDDQVFEGDTLSYAVGEAWTYVCTLPEPPIATTNM